MRTWLACLAPWMAMTAALAQTPESVTVEYTFRGTFKDDAVRSGGVLYVSPGLMRNFGWNVDIQGRTALISGEGRNFRVDVLTHRFKNYLPLEDSLRYVGGIFNWNSETHSGQVLASVRNVEAVGDGVQIDSTLAVGVRAFRLSDPPRLVVDLTGANLEQRLVGDLPAGWRVNQYLPHVVRFVVESPDMATFPVPALQNGRRVAFSLKGAAAVAPPASTAVVNEPRKHSESTGRAEVTFAYSGGLAKPPTALFLDPKTIQLTFAGARAAKSGDTTFAGSSLLDRAEVSERGDGTTVVELHMKAPVAFQLSPIVGAVSLKLFRPAVGTLGRMKIVVDAGHGGNDVGATKAGVREKDLNLATARAIADELTRRGMSVLMTRSDDTFVGLKERGDMANVSQANLFVSVHHNSNSVDNSRSGHIVFYHQQDPLDMLLAECIRAEIAKVSRLPDLGIWSDRRIYQSGFAVLRHSSMPGVLLELGFVNHSTDRKRVQEDEFRRNVARAVAQGIEVYFGKEK